MTITIFHHTLKCCAPRHTGNLLTYSSNSLGVLLLNLPHPPLNKLSDLLASVYDPSIHPFSSLTLWVCAQIRRSSLALAKLCTRPRSSYLSIMTIKTSKHVSRFRAFHVMERRASSASSTFQYMHTLNGSLKGSLDVHASELFKELRDRLKDLSSPS